LRDKRWACAIQVSLLLKLHNSCYSGFRAGETNSANGQIYTAHYIKPPSTLSSCRCDLKFHRFCAIKRRGLCHTSFPAFKASTTHHRFRAGERIAQTVNIYGRINIKPPAHFIVPVCFKIPSVLRDKALGGGPYKFPCFLNLDIHVLDSVLAKRIAQNRQIYTPHYMKLPAHFLVPMCFKTPRFWRDKASGPVPYKFSLLLKLRQSCTRIPCWRTNSANGQIYSAINIKLPKTFLVRCV